MKEKIEIFQEKTHLGLKEKIEISIEKAHQGLKEEIEISVEKAHQGLKKEIEILIVLVLNQEKIMKGLKKGTRILKNHFLKIKNKMILNLKDLLPEAGLNKLADKILN